MFAALVSRWFQRRPSAEGFASLMIREANRAGYVGELIYEPEEFRLKQGNGAYFNLHNAYHAYTHVRAGERSRVVRDYVATLIAVPGSADLALPEARPLLRPVIRNRGMLDELRLSQARNEGWDAAEPAVCRAFGEDCVELLAIDSAVSTATLTQGPNEAWGIDLDQSLSIAHENLRDCTPDAFEEIAPGLFRGAWQDSYDTSRVLLPDVLERVDVHGRPVFMMPTRDLLLVTGDHDEKGIALMLEVSIDAASNGHCVSAGLYTYQERVAVPFTPVHVVLRERHGELRRMFEHASYAIQKQYLDKIHADTGEDIFVASCLLYARADTEPSQGSVSLSTWTEGVATSLPRTDRIAMVRREVRDSSEMMVVDWQQAMPVIGALLEQERDFYPPRFRTRGFPSDAQLARLSPL